MTPRPVIITVEAAADFDRHRDWYRRERPHAETRFVAAVLAALETIEQMPQVFAVVGPGGVRHVRVKRFPYALYYRTEPAQTTVFAIHHDSQDPNVWQVRV